ncbi:type 1 glutamine amidotransferase [Nocardioides sp. BP30]|uniref:type 1 glutamine amidotransferase domain-containing protein n=1 Tax=Nocardioides sp. BP30 TaxID=3036374 RepID=UPI002468EB44|nr:type 1 glutamine amidotransferase domain-containing protein [Nocardioides sp. BP30]WGL53597.1 type 1 glutamine amidotransferase [Nocardioides sp. BP30]
MPESTTLNGAQVAIIATDFFEEAELVVPRDRLREAGAEVKVYSSRREPIQATEGDTEPTRKVEVDGTFDDVDVEGTDILVVPGGTVNADRIRLEAKAQELVRAFDEAGKPLAFICHGPWLLVSAGRAKDRHLTSWPSLADDLRNAGASWVDEEVVVDGNLITSRKPDDLPAFVGAIENALAGSPS